MLKVETLRDLKLLKSSAQYYLLNKDPVWKLIDGFEGDASQLMLYL